MSGLDLLTERDLSTAPTEPAKRWKNWWRGISYNRCERCSHQGRPGQIYTDCCDPAWPSRDVAESNAERQIAYQIESSGRALEEFIGAYPEGERP